MHTTIKKQINKITEFKNCYALPLFKIVRKNKNDEVIESNINITPSTETDVTVADNV